jgi:predicted enzyme related to lactoylglutathione lyase
MSDAPLPIQVTLAVDDTAAMVRFYNAVFAAGLEPVAAYGTTLYRGALAGLPLMLCPNTLAGVDARQSRHQHTYRVPDVAATVERALAVGGTLHEATEHSSVVLDPDGNSIVFVAA